MEYERITAAPHWEWWIVLYFFFGGIAAGAYFIGTMVDLIGTERDRAISKLSYYITLPLVTLCGIFLIVDLGRPERFWHMLIESETFTPMFKYWSPMSFGSWILTFFGMFSGLSFAGVLAEDGRFGLGRFRGLAQWLHRGPIGVLFGIGGMVSAVLLGAYTGWLLTATNQPIWSDSTLLGALFLASAGSTGIATLLLLLRLFQSAPHDSVERLDLTDRWTMVLELVLLIAFFVSLGSLAPALLTSSYGILLLVGTLLVGVLIPLVLNWRPSMLGASTPVVTAVLVIVGGFILRYSVVMAGEKLLIAAR